MDAKRDGPLPSARVAALVCHALMRASAATVTISLTKVMKLLTTFWEVTDDDDDDVLLTLNTHN